MALIQFRISEPGSAPGPVRCSSSHAFRSSRSTCRTPVTGRPLACLNCPIRPSLASRHFRPFRGPKASAITRAIRRLIGNGADYNENAKIDLRP